MEKKELKEKAIEFLSSCEGYHQRAKELHWDAQKNSRHTLLDEIDSTVLDYQDKVAESVMGILNIRFGVGDLKTLVPDAKSLDTIIDEMLSDVINFKKEVEGEIKNSGLVNILDDFITDLNRFNYLKTLS